LLSVSGQARNGIAALDATTGLATAWNPGAHKAVDALAVTVSTVYAGGEFERIGGQARNGVAGLDPTTGRGIPLHVPDLSCAFGLAVSGSSLYVGGDDGVAAVGIRP
jgi:trimeric autotransporter adhesin